MLERPPRDDQPVGRKDPADAGEDEREDWIPHQPNVALAAADPKRRRTPEQERHYLARAAMNLAGGACSGERAEHGADERVAKAPRDELPAVARFANDLGP